MHTSKHGPFGDLRTKLLKAAAEIITEEGIKKLTLRSLSKRVGVSRTAPYRHFKNKDALLLAIAEMGFNELTLRYQRINRDRSLDPLSRLQDIGLAYIEFAINNPGAFRLMFGQEIIRQRRSEELCSDAKETFNEYLTAVSASQKEMKITKVGYPALANYFWTLVHGLAILIIDGQIQVAGEHCGFPTLLNDEKPSAVGDAPSMIAFSKQTIRSFWAILSESSGSGQIRQI